MIKKVLDTIRKYDMIDIGDKVVVGVSGGADSLSLLHVLMSLREKWEIEVFAVHINHCIRGAEADRDENVVREYCEKNNVKCYVFREQVKKYAKDNHLTEEEAGRKIRYGRFDEVMKKENANKIAIAHNKNDSVETVFINLIRGTGMKGLSGISPKTDKVIRPLIFCGRDEIEKYCEKNDIHFIIDSTNNESVYTRNKVRNQLIPYIKENMNKNAIENIARMSMVIKEEDEYLAKSACKLFKEALRKSEKGIVEIDINVLKKYDNVLVKRALRNAVGLISETNLKDIDRTNINDILKLLDNQSGKKVNLPNDIIAERSFDLIKIYNNEISDDKTGKLPITSETKKIEFKFEIIDNICGLIDSNTVKHFDYDKIDLDSLTLRNKEEGDYIYLKTEEDRQKIKKFFTNSKIPQEIRNKIPLLVQNNNVLWIVGYKTSPFFKISESTKRVLRVDIESKIEN